MKKLVLPAITLTFMGIIVLSTNWYLFFQVIKKISPVKLTLAYVFYILSFWARAWRWKVMLPEESIWKLFKVVSLHTLYNNTYPARTGELGFIYLLKDHPKSKLTSILILARLGDMLSILIFLAISSLAVVRKIKVTVYAATPVIASLILIGILLWTINRLKLPQRIKTFIEDATYYLSVQKRVVHKVILASLVVWGIKYTCFYLLTKSIMETQRIEIGYWQSTFGVSLSELTTVLPIHSVAGIGTFEAGWTGAYTLMGFSYKLAVTTGFAFHITLLIFSILSGLLFIRL